MGIFITYALDDIDLKSKIKIAKEAVEQEDEPYKTEGFKVILAHLLDSNVSKKTATPKSTSTGSKKDKKNEVELQKDHEELAKKCGITIEELKETISTENNQVEILKEIQGSEAFKQLIGSQCILATYRVLFEQEWISGAYLKKSLDLSGVGGFPNLAVNLGKYKKLIVSRGKTAGTKYMITGIGLKSAYGIIKKVAKGESLNEN